MRDKVEIEFYDKDKTLLEQILEKKILHSYGCLGGSCGACKVKRPTKGRVITFKEAIYPLRDDYILPCICKIPDDVESVSLEFNKRFIK